MPWWASRTSCGGCGENRALAEPAAGARGHRRGEPGGPLRHRLRDDDHRAGVRAAVRAVGHRRPAVRAARHRLHRVDPGLAGHVDHASRPCSPIICCPAAAAPMHGDSFVVRQLKRGNAALLQWAFAHRARRAWRRSRPPSSLPAIAAILLPRSFLPPFNEGTLLVTHAVQSRHLARGVAPARLHRRADRRAGSGGALGRPPHRPRRTRRARRGRAQHRNRCRSRALGALQGGGLRRHPRSGCRCCRLSVDYRPADRAPPRSHAVGRAGADRAQDLSATTSIRCGGWPRRCASGSQASPGSSICRSRSRS